MIILASTVTELGEGGVQVVNRLILDAAAAAGLSGAVLSLHDRPGAPWTRVWPDSLCARGSRLRFAWGAMGRRRHARDSVLLATHTGLTPVARVLRRLTGAPLCVFLHGVEAWRAGSGLRHWGLSGADRFVSNSRFTLERFRRIHGDLAGVPGDVCYLPARLSPAPGSVLARSGRRVLVVGRLWGRGLRKGQEQLITVWPDIVRDHPDAELWIVGEGEGRGGLEEAARASGAGDAIRFTGGVSDEDLASIYAASDVFAMPSEDEGFGLVFAEAMAHGLPCVASRFDAGGEVVQDGETGLLVDPASLTEILSALRRLLGDEGFRRRMGEAARRRAAQDFSLEGFNRRIVSVLRHGRVDG